jgi:hypothetical protein
VTSKRKKSRTGQSNRTRPRGQPIAQNEVKGSSTPRAVEGSRQARPLDNAPGDSSSGKKARLWQRLMGNPTWAGITGIAGIVAILVSVGIFLYTLHMQHANSVAKFEVSTTYQYDGSDKWTMNADITNDGPAVAAAVHVDYSAIHESCFVIELIRTPGKKTRSIVRSMKSDLQCPGGSAFVGADQTTSLPGLFIHPLVRLSSSPAWGLFSGTAYNVHPEEQLWINLHFKVTPSLNHMLVKLLPSRPLPGSHFTMKRISPFLSRFGHMDVTGDNVSVSIQNYDAVNYG